MKEEWMKTFSPKVVEAILEGKEKSRSLGHAFTWGDTPEGGHFWYNVSASYHMTPTAFATLDHMLRRYKEEFQK